MVNLRLDGHFENINLGSFRKADRSRIDGLISYFNSLELFPYLKWNEMNPQYKEIELGVIFNAQTDSQRRLLDNLRNAGGSNLELGDYSFKTSFEGKDKTLVGLGRALLVPVRTLWERIPFTGKPADIDLFLADPEGIKGAIELMDLCI